MLAGSPPHSPQRSSPPQVNLKSIDIESFRGDPEQEAIFERVSQALWSGKRIIVVTGAGISVSSGIPDFRSAGGLYEKLGLQFGSQQGSAAAAGKNLSIKGKDFFDASFFHAPQTRRLFYRFIAELKEMCDEAIPTATHHFLKELINEKRILRWYTQNIDGLEERVGLLTTVTTLKIDQEEEGTEEPSKNVPVVGLHGTLSRLSCTVCKTIQAYDGHHESLKSGEGPSCGTCKDRQALRAERGQRSIKTGILRPDIVLYNEPHPQGDLIAEYINSDLSRRPTMLLVMGTSLKVVGLKRMIKDIAKAVHATSSEGSVVYLNKTGIQARSEWKSVFDYELVGESDRWVDLFRAARPKKTTTMTTSPVVAPVVSRVQEDEQQEQQSLTPIKPPTKSAKTANKIDTFFKHVKSTASSLVKTKSTDKPTASSKNNSTASASVGVVETFARKTRTSSRRSTATTVL